MHAYPHTLPLADTNCIILTVHQQLYMEKGDSPHFDHHHEVLENKKGPQWTYFKPWGGPSRPIQATVHRVAANTHGPPTTHFGMHDIGAHLSVRDILELLHNGRVLVYVCISTTAWIALHWREGSLVIAVASVPAGSHWPIVSFGARVKRRPCKRCQNLANLRQKHNRQIPASWESSVLLLFLHTWNHLNSVRWRYKIWAYIRPSACSVGRGVMLSVMFMGVWMNSQMCAYF